MVTNDRRRAGFVEQGLDVDGMRFLFPGKDFYGIELLGVFAPTRSVHTAHAAATQRLIEKESTDLERHEVDGLTLGALNHLQCGQTFEGYMVPAALAWGETGRVAIEQRSVVTLLCACSLLFTLEKTHPREVLPGTNTNS